MATSYISGWNTYVGGHPLDVCETEAARRGWWAANASEAACLVVDYLAATGQAADIDAFVDSLRQHYRPEPGIEDDYEWIRRGC